MYNSDLSIDFLIQIRLNLTVRNTSGPKDIDLSCMNNDALSPNKLIQNKK